MRRAWGMAAGAAVAVVAAVLACRGQATAPATQPATQATLTAKATALEVTNTVPVSEEEHARWYPARFVRRVAKPGPQFDAAGGAFRTG